MSFSSFTSLPLQTGLKITSSKRQVDTLFLIHATCFMNLAASSSSGV
jgi:hypothetical protein